MKSLAESIQWKIGLDEIALGESVQWKTGALKGWASPVLSAPFFISEGELVLCIYQILTKSKRKKAKKFFLFCLFYDLLTCIRKSVGEKGMDELKKLEKEAIEKALSASEEIKKLKQKQAQIQDKIARLKKRETDRERKARTRRLIFLGATIEKYWGASIAEGSKDMSCILYYLPQVKKIFDEGKFDTQWDKMQGQEK